MNLHLISTLLFALALVHTFLASRLTHWSHKFPEGSTPRAFLHLVGEVEVVFGIWAAVFLVAMATLEAPRASVDYIESLKFTEPLFVFVIMVVCATRPILIVARDLMSSLSWVLQRFLKLPKTQADVFSLLGFGPILGSFITEPAAMTVIALLLRSMVETLRPTALYTLMAVLFVNVSVGGSFTPYAAPPILMVAAKWGWDLSYVFSSFGLKSFVVCLANAFLFVSLFWRDIGSGIKSLEVVSRENQGPSRQVPLWMKVIHLIFLVVIVGNHTHSNLFMGVFLFFLGFTTATKSYQETLRMRESLLVAFFLGGLMIFGEFQKWWLQPLLAKMSEVTLFLGATGLTAITDNAALTYLGSQVEGLADISKYALVAGALAGGGLTVLANAPNPAGYSILVSKFPDGVVNHFRFLLVSLGPTLVAVLFLGPWF